MKVNANIVTVELEDSTKEVFNLEKLNNQINKSIEWLIKQDCGCSIIDLNDQIGIIIGWMPGYDEDPDDGDIHGKDDPTYCINIGLGVTTSDYMSTDMEYINQPYNKDTGDVWDTQITVSKSCKNFKEDIKWLLKEYEEMLKYDIDDDGCILCLKADNIIGNDDEENE